MKSNTYSHGTAAAYAEINQRGRVHVTICGDVSKVAHDALTHAVLFDLSAQTNMPVSVLKSSIAGKPRTWHQRIKATLFSIFTRNFARVKAARPSARANGVRGGTGVNS